MKARIFLERDKSEMVKGAITDKLEFEIAGVPPSEREATLEFIIKILSVYCGEDIKMPEQPKAPAS